MDLSTYMPTWIPSCQILWVYPGSIDLLCSLVSDCSNYIHAHQLEKSMNATKNHVQMLLSRNW